MRQRTRNARHRAAATAAKKAPSQKKTKAKTKATGAPEPSTALVPAAAGLAAYELAASARSYVAAAKAEATRRAYRTDWQAFEAWCAAHRRSALPAKPETVALYLAAMADGGHKASSITRALTALSQAHKAKELPSPRSHMAVLASMQGIRRILGVAPAQKAPILLPELRGMVAALPANTLGTRDRALLLLGFAGAFRRSELAALNQADVAFSSEGLEVLLRRSKTDQEGEGRKVGIPFGSDPSTCPVRALKAWLEALAACGTHDGARTRSDGPRRHAKGKVGVEPTPLFQSLSKAGRHILGHRLDGRDVARAVKRAAKRAGLPEPERFAGHSLRAGLATVAAQAGKSERAIMAQTGHRSVMMVRRYIRDGNLFTDNAAAGIGL